MLDDQRVDVVVQWVRTSWTKRSRGGTEAARRNAVPTAFPLPILRTPFVHEVLTDEHDDFQPHSTTRDGLPDSDDDLGVSLREAGGLLRIELVVTPSSISNVIARSRRVRRSERNAVESSAPSARSWSSASSVGWLDI